MSVRRDDAELARLEKRLQEAREETAEVKRRGRENEPVLTMLGEHLKENRFAERLALSLRDTRRHA